MKKLLLGLVLSLACACGSSTDGSGNADVGSSTSGTGGTTGGTTTGTTSSGTGGTTAGATSAGTTTGSSNAPPRAVMDNGNYTVSIVLDTNPTYTTCSTTTCSSLQTSPANYLWVVTDDSNGGSAYSIGGSSMVSVMDGNQWAAQAGPSNGTTTVGCADQVTTSEYFFLSATSFTGAGILNFQAQACNGYAAVNCECAYSFTATESSSSDGGEQLVVVEHNAINELMSGAHSR